MPPTIQLILDIDHTLKLHNTARDTPPVPGMPELISAWAKKWNPAIQYVTNRWGPMAWLGLGPASFILQHYPVGTIQQRPWYDLIGWASRSTGHKNASMVRLSPTKYDVVIMLGDDVDFDAVVYIDAVKGGIIGGTCVTVIGIRSVSGALVGAKWEEMIKGLPVTVHAIVYKDAEGLADFVSRVVKTAS